MLRLGYKFDYIVSMWLAVYLLYASYTYSSRHIVLQISTLRPNLSKACRDSRPEAPTLDSSFGKLIYRDRVAVLPF